MRRMRLALFCLAAVILPALQCGCSSIGPYKPDAAQGNVITEEMLAQLKTGMSKDQVSDIMGLPVIDDPFNSETWVYTYTHRHGRHREAPTH